MFEFKIKYRCKRTKARIGEFITPHGIIKTPCFMPVGTKGSVKTLDPNDLNLLDANIILANTYHLELRPGSELIKKMGGLHKWINWDKPMLTDSGGYQVFSLGQKKERFKNQEKLVKITEEGVHFRSIIDGSKLFFTPEKVMEIQQNLGADIIMAFDECAPHDSSREYAEKAMIRTHNWLNRCIAYKEEKGSKEQALFGIIQGCMYEDLRIKSAKFIAEKNLPGIAIGGLSVGEGQAEMLRVLDQINPFFPDSKVRYLMGVGDPLDLLEVVKRGVDIFDCVLPTRLARHGTMLNESGYVNLLNNKFLDDKTPLSENTKNPVHHYSKSYIRHLIKENEITGLRILTINNIFYLFDLLEKYKEAIKNDETEEFIMEYKVKTKKIGFNN